MNDALRWLMRDEIEAGRQQGRQEGRQEGMQLGRLDQARDTAYELRKMGLPTEKIARAVKVNLETLQEWFVDCVK